MPGVGGFVPPFSPTDLTNLKNWFVNNIAIGDTGCILWWDYNTASDGQCSSPDNAHHFTFATPQNQILTLNTYNVVGYNLPPIVFAPNNPASLLIGAMDSITTMAIFKADGQGVPAPGQVHAMQDSPSNSLISVGLGGGGSNNNLRFIVRTDNGQIINIDAGLFVGQGWKIVCWTFNFATKTARIIFDGNSFTGNNAAMDVFNFGNPTSTYYVSCNYNIAPYYAWDGQLGEFVEYTGVKTDSEINQLGNYFATKYGLTWTNI